MDFRNLGNIPVTDDINDINAKYVSVENGQFRKPEESDVDKAKVFLSKTSRKSKISLYDHLAALLKTVLRSRIEDAADTVEEISFSLKKSQESEECDPTKVVVLEEDFKDFLEQKKRFYKFIPSLDVIQEIDADDEEDADEEDNDDEEENASPKESEEQVETFELSKSLPDIQYSLNRFRQAGIGLREEEVSELDIALKDLAIEYSLRKVKFWGKVHGLYNDYYVAEAPYQKNIIQEKFGWEPETEIIEESEEDENQEKEEDEDSENEKEEEEEKEEVKEPKELPIPQPKPKIKKNVPPEENGTGVNEFVYFVCTKLGDPWRILPFLTPSQIVESRYLKKFFTGDLDCEVRGCVPFPGREAHYLRCQIARITASTYVAPDGFYKFEDEDDDDEENDDEEDEEEKGKNEKDIIINEEFKPKTIKEIHSEDVNAWVHYRRAILNQGRCKPMKRIKESTEEEDEKEETENNEEEEKEEEEPEILEAIIELEIPLLRSLTEDKVTGRLKPWTLKLSSQLVRETAIIIVHSNVWPGAYTFYDGKNFDHIYIGYGYKYSLFHYAPPIKVMWQSEYPVGEDVLEYVDEEVLSEEEEKEENETEGNEESSKENNENSEED